MVDKIKGGLADNMTLDSIAEKHGVTLSVIESALADGIAVEMEHTDDKEQATEIAKDHLFEDAEYYSKLAKVEKQNKKSGNDLKAENAPVIDGYDPTKEKEKEEKKRRNLKTPEAPQEPDEAEDVTKYNSKDWAKIYKASNFIEKGVCTYNDETIYLSQECLNNAIQSIKGRPVVIKHQKVDPSNMQDHAVGYVSDGGFCDQEASFYCNFLVFDDEGKEVIAKDYSVSCAYIPKAFGKGGTWHNTPYDREVTELEFTHLALVPDPRYEDAKIYENSKDDDNTTKETYNMEKIEVEQGFLASLIELAQKPFMNSKKEEEPKEEEKIEKDDDELEYEGKKYSKKELVNAFESACEGKKAKEEKEMKNEKEAEEEVVEAEKENSKDSDDDIEFFNSMQKLMAEAQTDASDKVELYNQNKGLELGSKAFG